jgi:uncharacterized protein involved in outer membrane biogenesis
MKRAVKILLGIVGVVLVLVIIAVVVAALNIDRIVKRGVETYGPQITKVTVKLDAVHVGLMTGSASIKGLTVGNPPGYQAPQAISVGEAAIGVKPSSILSPKIIVRSIKVNAPHITVEGTPHQNNLTTIRDNVSGTADKGGPPPDKSQPASTKKFEVDDFLITDAKVDGTIKLLNRQVTINRTLHEIHLTNLGTNPEGITGSELTKRVMNELTQKIIQELEKDAAQMGAGAIGTTNVNELKNGIKDIKNIFKK